MTDIHFRPATEQDLAPAAELFVSTLDDLVARKGLLPSPFTPASVLPVYRHIWRTGIFEVAEVDGQLGSICHAIVRDDLWFLAGFWTRPALQRQKIGGALLKRVRDEGRRRGATLFFTWSSIDLTAMATYMKMGMLPGYPILNFGGRATALPELPAGYTVEPLTLPSAMSIDEAVRATAREVDHAFWLASPGAGYEVRRDGCAAGYFYVTNGSIGPGAWIDPEHGPALVSLALREAARQAETVRLMALGCNHTAIQAALAAGLRLQGFAHLLTTEPFGRMEQYIPSGPSLF